MEARDGRKKITQVELGRVLGVERAAIGHYLARRRKMSTEQFFTLCRYLKKKPEELWDESASAVPAEPDPTAAAEAPSPYTAEAVRVLREIESQLKKLLNPPERR
jgi:transcriptional regulator with XRE-family HTH domain